MLGSRNYFFKSQTQTQLEDKRLEVYNLLKFKYGYTVKQCKVYQKAYNYFLDNRGDGFDGSTFSKDLFDVYSFDGKHGLDLDAMLHDYWYIVYNVSFSWLYVEMADRLFSSEIAKKNKSDKYFHIFVFKNFYSWYKLNGLRVLRLVYTPYKKLTSNMTPEQLEAFINDYYTLMT